MRNGKGGGNKIECGSRETNDARKKQLLILV